MKLFFRKSSIAKGLGLIVTACAILALASLRPGDSRLYPAHAEGVTVYVINNGFHTDIALPAEVVRVQGGALAASGALAGGHNWLIYGWGDAGFFTAQGFSPARAVDGLRALLWPNNPSVIRLYGVDRTPDLLYGRAVAVPVVLSPEGFDAMTRHIEASFRLAQGKPVVALTEPDGTYFFNSIEHFSVARSCNNWAADQLSAAGLPTTPAIDGLAPMLSLDLRLRAHVVP